MLNIMLCGCGGRMGAAVIAAAQEAGDRIVAGVDINPAADSPFPIFTTPEEFQGKADVIVDFSHHSALPGLLAYATETKTPLVVCTTGHTEEETAAMKAASESVAVFFSRNMSLGINLLISLCRRAAATLGADFDIEIIEKHHNKKLDAPSGTALMIADALSEEVAHRYVYDRHAERRQREKGEIGLHAVRGGTIVGEHEVLFCGKDEIVTLAHSAASREVFATGALRAARFMKGKGAGFYNMDDVIGSL
ncbi:MAG: 4-hydroxy-tetrahydrodipicolinate reductase [Ruminococcaceae bacterium]|nr:4-hydroxy-tetrahydrodipicolinate reductase [Oscillospiraceae bacterium]